MLVSQIRMFAKRVHFSVFDISRSRSRILKVTSLSSSCVTIDHIFASVSICAWRELNDPKSPYQGQPYLRIGSCDGLFSLFRRRRFIVVRLLLLDILASQLVATLENPDTLAKGLVIPYSDCPLGWSDKTRSLSNPLILIHVQFKSVQPHFKSIDLANAIILVFVFFETINNSP